MACCLPTVAFMYCLCKFSFAMYVHAPCPLVEASKQRERESINTLRPRQNGRHYPDEIFKCIFLNENAWISIKISLKSVPDGLINNIPALVQIMAWRRQGDKPLFEPVMARLPTHICVTRPQWVNNLIVTTAWIFGFLFQNQTKNLKLWYHLFWTNIAQISPYHTRIHMIWMLVLRPRCSGATD